MNNKKEKKKTVRNLMLGVTIVATVTMLAGCGAWTSSNKPQPEVENSSKVEDKIAKDESDMDSEKEADIKEQEDKGETEDSITTNEEVDIDEGAKPLGESIPQEQPTKPIIIPEPLSEEQLYAAYNNTLIIGDSRTEGFKLYSGVKNASYFCMKAMTIDKIAGGKTATVNGRTISVYDMLDAGSYDKIIIGVGLNELGWNHIETFLKDYGTLIDNIKEKQPNATIYLQAVLPVTKTKSESDKVHNNAQIYWYNENIIALAESKGVQYVNPAGALVNEEGFLVEGASNDGVHLNSAYCKVWAEYLAQLIK